jgi:NTE family protein
MALNYLTDLARVGQYLRHPVRADLWLRALRADLSVLEQLRRGLLPLPFDRAAEPSSAVFPPAREPHQPVWQGRRVAVVATGGSGALASVVGVVRALGEAGVTPTAYGLCSGSAMFGIPLAAGLSTDEVARGLLRLRPDQYLDPGWRRLAVAPLRLGRGWAGLMDGEAVERAFTDLLGPVTLGELATPVWFPAWGIEENRLRYISSLDDPDLPAARAVRMAIALPLAFEPVAYQGHSYLDGGIVEILPSRPFVQADLADVAVVVNGFYRPGFHADEDHRWRDEPLSLLRVSGQTRLMGHVDAARRSLDDLQAATEVHMLEPVPYGRVQGAGLYTEFVDRRGWPDYMRAGHESAWAMLDRVEAPVPRRRRREPGRESPSVASRSLASTPARPA